MPFRRTNTSSSPPSSGSRASVTSRPSPTRAKDGPSGTRRASARSRGAEGSVHTGPGVASGETVSEGSMDEERFNQSLRKLLKQFGVTAQREVEQAVRAALESGALRDGEVLE